MEIRGRTESEIKRKKWNTNLDTSKTVSRIKHNVDDDDDFVLQSWQSLCARPEATFHPKALVIFTNQRSFQWWSIVPISLSSGAPKTHFQLLD